MILPLALAACGEDATEDDFSAEVVDAEEALSDDGGDTLFDLAVSAAKEAYDPLELSLSVTPEEGDEIPIEIVLSDDADDDGKLGKGDSARGMEPATNVIGAAAIGTTFTVKLVHTPAEGDAVELFSGEWVAE
jgi:hypothetical protein